MTIKERLKEIHDDGFNVYMMLNKLKKVLKRPDFPDEVIIRFCEAYWKHKPVDKKAHYPYFLKTFQLVSAQWHAENQQREGEKYKKAPVSKLIKDILKEMGT